ncbi:hypothetical protein NMG60_11020291 [Bertholletia excelsa]
MSTDLEFRRGLTQLRLQAVIIQPSNGSTAANSSAIQSPGAGDSDNVGECRTPTSPEHKIPEILSCPPAPRKPRQPAFSCKRKLCELEFFEILNREEVESFFRSNLELRVDVKRRCACK